MITHHPHEELLLDYASGSLSEALAIAISTHASMCDDCRAFIRDLEVVGGVMLAEQTPVAMTDHALEVTLSRLDAEVTSGKQTLSAGLDSMIGMPLPAPLVHYVKGSLDSLPWKRIGRLFDEYRLPVAAAGVKAALLRLTPGSLMPRHSHRGQEYTLVLAGGYRDGDVAYGPGDFSAKDPSDNHQPLVDDDGPCICLVALDAPLRLSGAVGVLVNPFLRI